MHLFTLNETLDGHLQQVRAQQQRVAFVPTMGALHEGHLSLLSLARKRAGCSLCSVFVNPTQFDRQGDLDAYPRMLERDARLLEQAKCDVLFVPSVEQVYPEGLDTKVSLSLGEMDQVMEGRFRPGHFTGMLQVVKRLLDLTRPDELIMGQKDFQQFTLVAAMIRQLKLPCQLVVAATVREADGLAMSSRNLRLTPEFRTKAPAIYKCLQNIRQSYGTRAPETLALAGMQELERAGLRPEYLNIVDGESLADVRNHEPHDCVVACVAAWAGEVRLIDNLILKGQLP
ncbi:MAG: pantoate--beta-alanine ligase [Saprospiraceae bacterium]|nr:pantoate--beta-alanine ligase [Saprospiraceae bacterium]MBP9210222.1 pantoate--beta-alanine ligase [Saprospiraceae bacterium]